MNPMGKQHDSEPMTGSDQDMSKKHKMHRREVDMVKDPEKKLKMSIKYNLSHAKEHMKALKDSKKRLEKMGRS